MDTIKWVVSTAPEIFLLLAVALGTMLGRMRIAGFSIGTTACTLIVAVVLGQLGNFVIPPLFKSIFFSLFVFTIGYKSGARILCFAEHPDACRRSAWPWSWPSPALPSFSPSPLPFIWIRAQLLVLRPALSPSRP